LLLLALKIFSLYNHFPGVKNPVIVVEIFVKKCFYLFYMCKKMKRWFIEYVRWFPVGYVMSYMPMVWKKF